MQMSIYFNYRTYLLGLFLLTFYYSHLRSCYIHTLLPLYKTIAWDRIVIYTQRDNKEKTLLNVIRLYFVYNVLSQ
jgi:hypothetical protein